MDKLPAARYVSIFVRSFPFLQSHVRSQTYTMMGEGDSPGIIPLTVQEMFNQIDKSSDRVYLVRIGYIEIYNEKIYDLLNHNVECTKIQEDNGNIVVNQKEVISSRVEEILELYESGNKQRSVGVTNLNERSSRSHTIFRITIQSKRSDDTEEDTVQLSHLNLVDLAGSERAHQMGAKGDRLRQAGSINKSLLSLSRAMRTLSEGKANQHVNFRDSKLTRILSASLGGNAMTSIIATITLASLEDTYSTFT